MSGVLLVMLAGFASGFCSRGVLRVTKWIFRTMVKQTFGGGVNLPGD